ncbi:MAG: UPF0182 family protein [Methylococcales bacterium]|nr:UPF0182 family protein [Methylococcales bacterium]MDD5753587.1 UPF0182 family protein [Methylococcales bacterium]
MRNLKFLPALLGSIIALAVVLFVAFHFIFIDFFVDWWWYDSLKLESYFWLRTLYKFFLSGGVTLVFFLIFFSHFWIASRYLGLNIDENLLTGNEKSRVQKFSDTFMNGSVKIYTPISFILALGIATPFYEQWESTLLYFFGSASGVTETVYGNDVSFYMLSYPTYQLIQQGLLITALLIFIMVGVLYWLEHTYIPDQHKNYPKGAKIHLTFLIGLVVAFVLWGFMLQRFSLLYTDNHEPIFFGPGFVEVRYQLPLIWAAMGTFLIFALVAIQFVHSEKHDKRGALWISMLLFLAVWQTPNLQFIPDALQRFVVNPNPVKAEKPFMQHNIDATLAAYGLKNIKTVEMTVQLDAAQDIQTWSSQKHFENIPVWDREDIIFSYKQLQEIRPYYKFLSVDEDRYFISDHLRQVNIAAREINVAKLPKEAQNWENRHLRYTHGYGAVITPAAQDADAPLTWYLRDLNMSSEVGLTTNHPDIYYGQEQYDYAIVPNKLNVVGIAGTNPDENNAYHGEGGIPITSLFKKLLFAFKLGDEKLFFSTNISGDSKLKIYRNVHERIHKLTPFLHLDKDPYLVMTKDRFYWIQDAYTLSDKYPVSKPMSDEKLNNGEPFNYIRNSVKIVVDALDGDVDYYLVDKTDAIASAYNRAYPNLFKSLSEVPNELKAHLRYPRDLFTIQMRMYAKYHQTSPELFYEQAETWAYANVREKPVLPYYQTMDFGNCNDTEEFVLIEPMTPVNRNNLSMVSMASSLDKTNCTDTYTPNITVFKFGKEVQVNGPEQIEALTQQHPEISEQFTLWDQNGSSVEMGRMVILPMGNTILYVQPIYIASTKNKMPELTRIIVSIGNETVMDTTLHSALNRLKNIFINKTRTVDTAASKH